MLALLEREVSPYSMKAIHVDTSMQTQIAKHTTGGPSAVILHASSLVVVPAEGISSLIWSLSNSNR